MCRDRKKNSKSQNVRKEKWRKVKESKKERKKERLISFAQVSSGKRGAKNGSWNYSTRNKDRYDCVSFCKKERKKERNGELTITNTASFFSFYFRWCPSNIRRRVNSFNKRIRIRNQKMHKRSKKERKKDFQPLIFILRQKNTIKVCARRCQ